MHLGTQLRAVRIEAGLSQKDLVERGVAGQSTISETENNRRPTTTDVVERWVEACRASIVIAHDKSDRARLVSELSSLSHEMLQTVRIAVSALRAMSPEEARREAEILAMRAERKALMLHDAPIR